MPENRKSKTQKVQYPSNLLVSLLGMLTDRWLKPPSQIIGSQKDALQARAM